MNAFKALAATLVLVLVVAVAPGWAHGPKGRAALPSNFVDISFTIWHPAEVGFQHQFRTNVFFTGKMEYLKRDRDLLFRAGAAYMVPRKFWIFRPYGGGGLEFARNEGQVYPYAAVGTKFWIFYSEVSHALLSNQEPSFRFGFSFSF